MDSPTPGTYRAVLQLPGGETPFGLDIKEEEGKPVLYLVNGAERTRVTDVHLQDEELTARFPGYENFMRARLYRKRLEGEVVLIKTGGKEQVIPMRAEAEQPWRFFQQSSTDNADVSGRWQVTLEEDGQTTHAVAEFAQEHDQVTGSVLTPTGDHRFLAGQVRGDEVRLSTFAGGLAYLYHLRVNGKGNLEGDMWQGLAAHAKVNAHRNPDAELPQEERTQVKANSQFNFTFPDAQGKRVSLRDERFRGKVVIVTIGGTWCPNCHDEAGFLVPFYRDYKARGVEIIGLMFERHGEFEPAAKAVRDFSRDLSIPYPLLIAGISDSEEASKALPTLTGIYGYPTALFIDRTGRVRKIHTGFSGPATG
ncbi:MAG: TlpA disulfide reductase family protein, partial [Steroidobacteraceae bacterium]